MFSVSSDLLARQAIEAEIKARTQYVEQDRAFLKQHIAELVAENKKLQTRLTRAEAELGTERWAREKLEIFLKSQNSGDLPLAEELKLTERQLTIAQTETTNARKEAVAAWTENARLLEETKILQAALQKAEEQTTDAAIDLKVTERIADDRKQMERSLARAFELVAHETRRADMYRKQLEFFIEDERNGTTLPTPHNPLHLALMRIESLDNTIGKISPHHATWLKRYGQTTDCLTEPVIPEAPKQWRTSSIQTEAADGSNAYCCCVAVGTQK
jgi:regulator of replication initiation timing